MGFHKFLAGAMHIGQKISSAASFLGHKVGGILTAAAPVVSILNPAVGQGVAAAGMVSKGVGALGDMGSAALRGGDINVQAARRTLDNIRSDAGRVREAYNSVRGPGNPLERRR